MEDIVFIPAGAVRALQAAHQQHSNAYRHQDGEYARVDSKPVK